MRRGVFALLLLGAWLAGVICLLVYLEATGGWYEYHTVVRPKSGASLSYEEELSTYWARGCRLAGRWDDGAVVGCPRYPLLGLNRWTP